VGRVAGQRAGRASAGRAAPAGQRDRADTASRILDVAERIVQVRGFNAFSYADVAAELEITKAALHYHFPGKAELGQALITRYAERFAQALAGIESSVPDAPSRLEAYADLYLQVVRDERMCLCGMLASEYPTLPPTMQDAVVRFFEDNEAWLTRILRQGDAEGTLRITGSTADTARMIVSSLEGAVLVTRPRGDVARFESVADYLLAGLRS
jgi:TetR/AcrR family transcriptional regulator, transcriptional repressor for nem operon